MDRFEDVIAWQKARALNKSVYEATRSNPMSKDFGFVGQIQRASISVMNNIAEGFERNRLKEFHQYLSIAKASTAEVRSMLYAAHDIGYLQTAEFDQLMTMAMETTRVIAGLRSSVARRLTDQERRIVKEEASIYDALRNLVKDETTD
ncbi:MAG: four helix bundle protein [Tepidiformaceae bacterium]